MDKEIEKIFCGKKVLITGGAGSLGSLLVKELIKCKPAVVRVFDTDEARQYDLQQDLSENEDLRFIIGDIRDGEKIKRAMKDIDIVIHAAALKHVLSSEYNPFEAAKTNIIGTQNVIEAAILNNVKKVIFTSSDKAVNPNNTMGATKLVAERLIISANYSTGPNVPIFSVVRFGNVINTRGSVTPLFNKQIAKGGPLTLTHPDMTRFIMSPKQAVNLIFKCTETAKGGEVFILKMPVVNMQDLAEVMIEESKKKIPIKIIGPKLGESMYEKLMTSEEAKRVIEREDMYILLPFISASFTVQNKEFFEELARNYSEPKPLNTEYNSQNIKPITKEQLKNLLHEANIFR